MKRLKRRLSFRSDLPEGSASDALEVKKEGYLTKKSTSGKWQERYFEIATCGPGSFLRYFPDAVKGLSNMKGAIDLATLIKCEVEESNFVLHLAEATGSTRMYHLRAETEDVACEWSDLIQAQQLQGTGREGKTYASAGQEEEGQQKAAQGTGEAAAAAGEAAGEALADTQAPKGEEAAEATIITAEATIITIEQNQTAVSVKETSVEVKAQEAQEAQKGGNDTEQEEAAEKVEKEAAVKAEEEAAVKAKQEQEAEEEKVKQQAEEEEEQEKEKE
jgi:hypothetical protein